MFGDKLGGMCSAAMEVAAGEMDLASDRVMAEVDPKAAYAARKRSFTVSRMVASQAVASEFAVTGCFLTVTIGTYVLTTLGFPAYQQLIPAQAATIVAGCDACLCDADGVIAAVDTLLPPGCVGGRGFSVSLGIGIMSSEIIVTAPLCTVPNSCTDDRVDNATAELEPLFAGTGQSWSQPAGFSWRTCDATTDFTSDECDPSGDATRDNVLAFGTVFLVQIAAILLGKMIMKIKLRKLVENTNRARVKAGFDPKMARLAELFVKKTEDDEAANRERDGGGLKAKFEFNKLSARKRLRGAIILTKFAIRLSKAMKSEERETVDGLASEVAEAVAEHWKKNRVFFTVIAWCECTILRPWGLCATMAVRRFHGDRCRV